MKEKAMRSDVYERVTNQIVSELEKGVRPWMQPWSDEHAAVRITRPLRANGIPYRGINVVMLWSEAVAKGYASPVWMTFKQAQELDAHVARANTAALSSMPPRSPAPRATTTRARNRSAKSPS